ATPGWGTGGTGSGAGGTGSGAGGAASPCPACAHDPAKARSLFARSKTGRAPVTLAVPPGAEAGRVAELVADDLAGVGVDLTATPSPPGETPVTLVRRVAPYPRPDPFLTGPFTISSQAQRQLDQARTTPGDPTRTPLYHQAEATVLGGLPPPPPPPPPPPALLSP